MSPASYNGVHRVVVVEAAGRWVARRHPERIMHFPVGDTDKWHASEITAGCIVKNLVQLPYHDLRMVPYIKCNGLLLADGSFTYKDIVSTWFKHGPDLCVPHHILQTPENTSATLDMDRYVEAHNWLRDGVGFDQPPPDWIIV